MTLLDDSLDKKIYKILLVDDEKDILDSLQLILRNSIGIKTEIITANTAEQALDIMLNDEFDLIVSDYKMPGMNGVDLLSMVNDIQPDTSRILITGFSDVEIAKHAINKAKVDNYIEKPWKSDEFRATVLSALIRKNDKKICKPTEVNNIEAALKVVDDAKSLMSCNNPSNQNKQILILEFKSPADFNKFSFEIRNMKNVGIDDVEIFENKYIVKLGIYLDSFETIV